MRITSGLYDNSSHIDPNFPGHPSMLKPDQGKYPHFYRRVQETIWSSWYRLQQCRSHGFLGISTGNFSKSLGFFVVGWSNRLCFSCWCWIVGCIAVAFDCMAGVSQEIVTDVVSILSIQVGTHLNKSLIHPYTVSYILSPFGLKNTTICWQRLVSSFREPKRFPENKSHIICIYIIYIYIFFFIIVFTNDEGALVRFSSFVEVFSWMHVHHWNFMWDLIDRRYQSKRSIGPTDWIDGWVQKYIFVAPVYRVFINWAVLSDEQMSNGWSFSLLNDEQMSNWVGVEHQPVNIPRIRTLFRTGELIVFSQKNNICFIVCLWNGTAVRIPEIFL